MKAAKEKYISFKHYPLQRAKKEFDNSRNKLFKVTTINWTLATENEKQRHDKVHKNEYEMTLEYLIDWIRNTAEVAEDIINIEPGLTKV